MLTTTIVLAVVASTSGALMPRRPPVGVWAAPQRTTIQMRIFDEGSKITEQAAAREERMQRTAAHYGLDPEADAVEIAALAASSLSEEENGTWRDVAICAVQNLGMVAVLLAAVGALPGQASAASAAAVTPSTEVLSTLLALSAEEADVIASIVVPLGVGVIAVGFLAANFERLIDKLNGD